MSLKHSDWNLYPQLQNREKNLLQNPFSVLDIQETLQGIKVKSSGDGDGLI